MKTKSTLRLKIKLRSKITLAPKTALSSALRNLIFSFTPLTQLQTWDSRLSSFNIIQSKGDFLLSQTAATSPLFTHEHCRQILQLRYDLENKVSTPSTTYNPRQLVECYDSFSTTKLLPIEIFARVAMCFGEIGYFGHWHFSLVSCLLLAVRNHRSDLVLYYSQFINFDEQDNYCFDIVVREAVEMDDAECVAILLSYNKITNIYLMRPRSKKVFDILLSIVEHNSFAGLGLTTQNCLFLRGYGAAKGWILDKTDSYRHDFMLGRWYAGDKAIYFNYAWPENGFFGFGTEKDRFIGFLIFNMDPDIFNFLRERELTPYKNYQFYPDYANIVTEETISNVDAFITNVRKYLLRNDERKSLMAYLEMMTLSESEISELVKNEDLRKKEYDTYVDLARSFGYLNELLYTEDAHAIVSNVVKSDGSDLEFINFFGEKIDALLNPEKDVMADLLEADKIELTASEDPFFLAVVLERNRKLSEHGRSCYLDLDLNTVPRTAIIRGQWNNFFPESYTGDRDNSLEAVTRYQNERLELIMELLSCEN